MLTTLRQLWSVLDAQERRRTLLMLVLMLCLALMEVAGVLSIAPLLAVAGNPELIEQQPLLAWAYTVGGFTSTNAFLIACALLALSAICLTSIFRAMVHYVMYRFANMRRHTLACRLLSHYLHLPFEEFAKRNVTDLSRSILSEVDIVINQGLMQAIRCCAYGMVIVGMVTLLVILNPWLAVVLFGLLGGAYALLFAVLHTRVHRLGERRRQTNLARYQVTQNILNGRRELSVLGRDAAYLQAYRTPSLEYTRSFTWHQTLSESPRFILEGIAFAAIITALLYVIIAQGRTLADVVPILGLYAYAGLRLLPSLQQVYTSLNGMRFAAPAQQAIINELSLSSPAQTVPPNPPLNLHRQLCIEPFMYSYPGSEQGLRCRRAITIPVGSKVAIIGPTGSGKSTLIDILLGLRFPQEGCISIDEQILDQNTAARWQRSLGYVPQQIFFADDSVGANIALGIPSHKWDLGRMHKACRIACIQAELLHRHAGLDAVMGDSGSHFSGGQRQRIGLARALYHRPSTILLDEATSALDEATESEVVRQVMNDDPQRTIFFVSHRPTITTVCDILLRVEAGEVAHVAADGEKGV